MKRVNLLITFTFLYFHFFSQNDYKHGFLSYNSQAEEKSTIPDYKLYAQQIHKKYDSLFTDKDEKDEFAKILISGLRSDFEDGNIYTNWNYANEYLTKVFKSILPVNTTDTLNIKIIRSSDVNAFMTGTGQAYITVGFLANALNEAEIASVLGHEYGHYVHLDIYRSYKEYLKNQKHYVIGNLLSGYGGGLFYLLSTRNTFSNFRDMERDADKTGIELAKNSNYNLLAAVNVQKRFKMIEDNYEKSKDYRHRFYFHTHPPTKERIENAQQAVEASDSVNSKYFLIDENLFQKIKLQAIDECINLFLQEQQFEDCIELCFKQLLFNPDDEFYLFYLNEALRRYLVVDPSAAEKLFITGRYTTYTKYLPKDKLPVYVMSEKKMQPDNDKITRTVFYHYEYLMLADKDKLLAELPVNELTRNDTLEFVTNKDALNYFISKQEKLKQSSVSWVKNCSPKTLQDINVNSNETFLNRYNEIKNDVLMCLSETKEASIPHMLTGVSYSGNAALLSHSEFNNDSLSKHCRKFFKKGIDLPFAYFDLSGIVQSDRHIIQKLLIGMRGYTFPLTVTDNPLKTEKTERVNLPIALLTPEVISTLNKYKLQQFITTDVNIIDAVTVSRIGTPLTFFVVFNIYYIDFKTGFLSHIMKKHMISSADELLPTLDKLNEYFPLSLLKK